MGRITPVVKILLICNVIFYIGSFTLGDFAYREFALYFFKNPDFHLWQPLTSMFMHSRESILHLVLNMYALWAFGSPVEQSIGSKKFIFFYFSAGLGAALIHSMVGYFDYQQGISVFTEAGFSAVEIQRFLTEGSYPANVFSPEGKEQVIEMFEAFYTPAVGASGAIYGILVAFGMLFPMAELMLIFLPVPIKAKYFIPVIILIDLFSGVTGFSIFGGGVAHFAHVGGALFGFIMMYYWRKHQFDHKRWD